MEHTPLLAEFVVLLAVAVGATLVSHRLRVPPVVGFLLTGILIGPSAIGLISPDNVETLAEAGVVALLFTTGLEFSVARLRLLQRPFFLGGSGQVLGTISVVFLVAWGFGISPPRAVFFGFLVAMSSTAIVLKLLSDRRELDTPQGRLSVGVLLFQDFVVVPMVVLTPLLAGRGDASPVNLVLRFAGGLAILGVVVLAARFLIPRLLAVLARTRVREIFLLGSLLLVLGMALLTETLEFSAALGGFIAGILLAESEYSHQIFADVVPFRDVFSSIFFISIGMLFDVRIARESWVAILGVAVGIMVVKAAVVTVTILAMKYPRRTAIVTGIGLAQIGEFSFLLLSVQGARELLGVEAFQTFIGASVFTMAATPLLISFAPGLALGSAPGAQPAEKDEEGQKNHVIVVGFGVSGRNLVHVLREVSIPHVVIELDGTRAEVARKEGASVIFGDVTRPEILRLAGIGRASVIVFGFADLLAVERGVRFSRELNPRTHIIVRTRLVSEIEELYGAGANEVIAEEFETSIEIFTRVLQRLHVPRNVIEAETKVLRADHYEIFRAPAVRHLSESVLDLLAAGATEIFLVRESGDLPGRSIRELALREQTGASIIAVARQQQSFPSPEPDFRLESGDHLIIMGGHAQVEEAFRYLQSLETTA